MLTAEVANLRQSSTLRYIEQLEAARYVPWGQLKEPSGLVEKLLRCHPGWLPHGQSVRVALGLTSFPRRSLVGRCEAVLLWGYNCPLKERDIQADHLFPLALGGPADGTNQVWLCDLHNQWKGCDLIPFPWELGEPQWLAQHLQRLSSMISPEARLEV